MTGPSIYLNYGDPSTVAFLDSQGRPIVTIKDDGAVLWRGRVIETDAEFSAAISEAVELMRLIVAGYGTPAPAPRSRLYARYWPYAPDWATHLATDTDGGVYAFDAPPDWHPQAGWLPTAGRVVTIPAPPLDPADSLEERPC